MPLDDYKKKRNFNETPEPSGGTSHRSPSGRTPRFFCVQKHLASHLHYDFRLEHEGVLLSWAVPKGPSLDPATKRLAMKVEDHPIEYGEFEGVIPSGYGAGIVMLWDRGTWTPEVDDVGAALRKGDLKLTLDGYKLKGSWVLVRTQGGWAGGSGGDRSWLLIKHRDDWSGRVDITEFAPLSVKSEGDFHDILAQDNPDVWRSNRPAQGGETGKMFERIVARALEMRGEAPAESPTPTAKAKRPKSKAPSGAAPRPGLKSTRPAASNGATHTPRRAATKTGTRRATKTTAGRVTKTTAGRVTKTTRGRAAQATRARASKRR